MSVRSLGIRRGEESASPTAKRGPIKDGTMFLKEIEVSEQSFAPDQVVDISLTVAEAAGCVPASDPDCCGPSCGLIGCWVANGHLYEVHAELEGDTDRVGPECSHTTEVGTYDKQHFLQVQAPSEEGTYTLNLTLMGAESGETGTTTERIAVQEPGGPPPGNGGNGINGGNGGNGGGGNGGDGPGDGQFPIPGVPLTQQQLVIAGGLGALGAGAFLLSGNGQQAQPRRRRQRTIQRGG